MKKLSKIFAVVLCLAMALSMLTVGASAASNTVTMDFTSLTQQGAEIAAEDALAVFQNAGAGNDLTAVTLTKVYDGNGTGGAYPDTAGFLKCGTGKVDGALELTFAKKVTKVEITCHDWYKKSDKYPTNTNTFAVNGGTAQLAPYTVDGTMGVLTFDIAASETVSINLDNTSSSGFGRAFISKITVTFEGASAGTEGTTATEGAGDSDKTADTTTIVPMVAVLTLAVTGLFALVISNKKRMF